jgi:branched-chain amino acid aminotransferase
MSTEGPRWAWVNGVLLPAGERHLSAFDRGFQLGDGVFETLRAAGGRGIELAEHTARLRGSADGLAIDLPANVDTLLAQGIREVLDAEDLGGADGDASVRITVTRGVWLSRGLLPAPDEHLAATIVIQAWRVTASPGTTPARGISVVSSAVRRDPGNPLATLKTTSRADYVYAKLEARRAGADDALFFTVDGHLSEATSANVFFVRKAADGVLELATPSLACAILAGTTRSWLLRWAADVGLRPCESELTRGEVAAASEVFLSASVAGVVPIVSLDGRPIGDGQPGPWTLRARANREAFITGSAL